MVGGSSPNRGGKVAIPVAYVHLMEQVAKAHRRLGQAVFANGRSCGSDTACAFPHEDEKRQQQRSLACPSAAAARSLTATWIWRSIKDFAS